MNETISKKKDGKICGLTTAMKYSTSKYGTYKPVADINMLFEADTYYVRTAASNANYEPSDPVEITIGEGRNLTVTIPAPHRNLSASKIMAFTTATRLQCPKLPKKTDTPSLGKSCLTP